MSGEATIRVDSENQSASVSHGSHWQRQQGSAFTTAEKGRRLLLPDEVRRLPREAQLLFVKGSAPLLVERLDYLRDPEFADRADSNPLYDGVGVSAVADAAT
jgi:type IV secretion system protein VirD4